MNARVRRRLLELVHGDGSHVCVPLQGSGTFIVEAMIGTLLPPRSKLLALVNGAYGRRIVRMCEYYRRACEVGESAEARRGSADRCDERLRRAPAGRAPDSLRRGGGLRQQVPRGRTGDGLRYRAPGGVGGSA